MKPTECKGVSKMASINDLRKQIEIDQKKSDQEGNYFNRYQADVDIMQEELSCRLSGGVWVNPTYVENVKKPYDRRGHCRKVK
jgi:hypothetical protein